MKDLVLYGIPLGLLALAAIKLAQDKLDLTDGEANLVRAIAGAALYLVVQNAEAIEAAWPYFETAVVQFGGALAIFLSILGYWDDVQRLVYRITGRALPVRLQ